MTQCIRVLKYMEEFGSISPAEAFTDLGVYRLASRIHDLAKAGYSINRQMVYSKNRYGESIHYMRYSLD